MRVCHGFTATFDDPNLVSCAGLAPVLQLAERAGLQQLVGEHVHLGVSGGVNAHLKIPSLVAGMIAGADSIDDMALLRHGAMKRLFTGVRAPSTLGTFLRSFTFGHVRQLDAVASRLLINLAGQAPLLPGADELAYVDVDDTLRQTYGYAKQGAGRGYTGVKGLNALLAIVSTPSAAPLITAVRLRKGSTNSARGAARFVTDALRTANKAGAGGVLVLRADSAYYGHDVIAAASRQGACFSITARQDKAVRKAISTIDDDAWTTIKYTDAVFDEASQQWISDAEVAEIDYTAFTSRPKAKPPAVLPAALAPAPTPVTNLPTMAPPTRPSTPPEPTGEQPQPASVEKKTRQNEQAQHASRTPHAASEGRNAQPARTHRQSDPHHDTHAIVRSDDLHHD